MKSSLPVSPLSLNQLTREYWGQYDAAVIAQLAQLADDSCYQAKFYKAPADDQEVFGPFGYVTYGMRITPGSIIFGFYLPFEQIVLEDQFTVQITDVSLEHKFWDEPITAGLISNFKPTYQSNYRLNLSGFPNLLCAPYPVTGSGQFDVEIQETSGVGNHRIELVFGVLEACDAS